MNSQNFKTQKHGMIVQYFFYTKSMEIFTHFSTPNIDKFSTFFRSAILHIAFCNFYLQFYTVTWIEHLSKFYIGFFSISLMTHKTR